MALIAKVAAVEQVEDFCTTVLSNFLFKVATKILADQLARLMSVLVSSSQCGFIHGHCIETYIVGCVRMCQSAGSPLL